MRSDGSGRGGANRAPTGTWCVVCGQALSGVPIFSPVLTVRARGLLAMGLPWMPPAFAIVIELMPASSPVVRGGWVQVCCLESRVRGRERVKRAEASWPPGRDIA